jgi:uncharacterized membrane protein (DUF2068 family)
MKTALTPWSHFAVLIAAAGLPIYVHVLSDYPEFHTIASVPIGLSIVALLNVVGLTHQRMSLSTTRAWPAR